MVGPGQELGRALNRVPNRIQAYTVNILGSIAGIVLFALFSWLHLSPGWWFAPIALGIAYFLLRQPAVGGQLVRIALLLMIVVVASGTKLVASVQERHEFWSPYYRIDYIPKNAAINVNLIGHQQMIPRDTPHVAYALPYLLHRDAGGKPFENIMIIGAGSGNDVSRALQWGAPNAHIDAVEIDPVIQQIGAKDHKKDLPVQGDPKPRDLLLVVDASYSAFGERYVWQTKLVRSLVEQMDERDRFQVLACDLDCRALWRSFQSPSEETAAEAARKLAAIEPGQATDVGAAFEAAARELRRRGSATEREARVIYVGDGVASAGELDAGRLVEEALEALGDGVRVTVVGAGTEADELVLTELARRGDGTYLPFTAGRSVRSLALAALSAQYGAALEDARLSLPAGFDDPQPRNLPAVRAGEELLLVARMKPHVRGEVVLKGRVGGRDYEQRYPIDLEVSSAKGNAFVPRVWAEAKIAELTLRDAAANKDRIVELSRDHRVLSRFTSLLVLESEAMYRAFGVERPEAAVENWTGEDAIEAQDFDGTVEHLGALGDGVGAGRAGGFRASAGPAPTRYPLAFSAPARDPEQRAIDAILQSEAHARREAPSPPRGGRWMRRTWRRQAEIGAAVGARNWDRKQVEELQAKYDENPESRDRTKALYLALSRAGDVDKALELAEKWWGKDRLDPEALERMALSEQSRGHGARALRLLGSMADLAPRDAALQERLASAYAAAGRTAESCAHRRALAALKPDDADAVAAAYQCLSWMGQTDRAEALIERFGNEMTRARLRSRLETSAPAAPDVRGDLRVEATWDRPADLDLVLVHPDGRRSTWMGGVAGTAAKDADDDRREELGFRRLKTGLYRIEIVRHDLDAAAEPDEPTDDETGDEDEADDRGAKAEPGGDDVQVAGRRAPDDRDDDRHHRARPAAPPARTIRGEVRISALGQSRRLSFTLADDEVRTGVASVEVTRFEVLVPVDGPPPPRTR